MIYVDSSVVLAAVLKERLRPPDEWWQQELVGSHLVAYETHVRLHAYGKWLTHRDRARVLIASVRLIEMSRAVLDRALDPFPNPVRTLDALHLATADYLRTSFPALGLATYDSRMAAAAVAMGFDVIDPA